MCAFPKYSNTLSYKCHKCRIEVTLYVVPIAKLQKREWISSRDNVIWDRIQQICRLYLGCIVSLSVHPTIIPTL